MWMWLMRLAHFFATGAGSSPAKVKWPVSNSRPTESGVPAISRSTSAARSITVPMWWWKAIAHAVGGHPVGELADPLEIARPLGLAHHRPVGDRHVALALHGAGGLGPDHDLAAAGLEQVEVRPHRRDLRLDRARAQIAAVPARDELEPVLAEDRLHLLGVVRELAALLDADEPGLGRLLQAGLQRRVAAELRHVVVGPGDRVGPSFTVMRLLPCSSCAQPIACAARALR